MINSLLIDGREFHPHKITGIGRVLIGLVEALSGSGIVKKIILAVISDNAAPACLATRPAVELMTVPKPFLASEWSLSAFTRANTDLFISPYPKLPLFGVFCPCIHIVHDVLYLTHRAYRRRLKTMIDKVRINRALKLADLTWYDSKHSLKATRDLLGRVGKSPKVRYPGLPREFDRRKAPEDEGILKKYGLEPGYILMVGNGLPHKNLGVILEACNRWDRKIVIVGVNEGNQKYWQPVGHDKAALWIDHVEDDELPGIFRSAFCLAQPSTAEGFGYPPLEAMACGVPAVVSRIPVLLETTGGSALSADPDRPEMWLNAFEALENTAIYQSQVRQGLNWVGPFMGPKGWELQIGDIAELAKKRPELNRHEAAVVRK